MGGTRIGGKKSAKTIGKRSLAERGAKGGSAKVPKGTAKWSLEKRVEAGRKGGLAKARKYQDPNFDKGEYRKRRDSIPKLRGQGDEPMTQISVTTPEEYLKRTNPEELKRQRGIDI